VAVANDGEHDQPSADDRIDRRERQNGESDASARFRGAVDIAPVQQAADQPLPPRFQGPDDRPRLNCHG